MKRQWLLLIVLFCVPLILTRPAPTTAAPDNQEQATWTLIVYIAADNDLEPFIVNDLLEMQGAGSTDRVNIVVQVDRATGYENVHGDWIDTRRFLITPGEGNISSGDFAIVSENFETRLRQLSPEDLGLTREELDSEIESIMALPRQQFESVALLFTPPPGGDAPIIGLQQNAVEMTEEINTGDPQALVEFTTWAIENYPAEHYGLVLWNHGGGWTMLASDEGNQHDALTLPEIESALQQITAQTDVEKFDLLGFDACLMSQLEVYKTVAPYADYALAAQEVIPGAGWEYTTPLSALNANPDMSVTELGQIFVDSYMTFYSEVVTNYNQFDLNFVDLSAVDNVIGALDAFSAQIASNPDLYLTDLGLARDNAQTFAAANSPDEEAYFSSVDLVHFMELLISISDDPAIDSVARNVTDSVSSMMLYSRANDGLPGANGLAIYFPINIQDFNIQNNGTRYPAEISPDFAGWINFLNVFHGTATKRLSPENLRVEITETFPADNEASIYDPVVVFMETEGQNIIDVTFYAALQIEDNLEVIVDASPLESSVFTTEGDLIAGFDDGLNVYEFAWNAEAPFVTDGINEVLTVLLSTGDNNNEAIITGNYHWADGTQANAYMKFDLTTGEAVSVWSVEITSSGNGVAEINVARGDRFEPTWRILQDGEVVLVPSETFLTLGANPITFEYQPAPSGQYVMTLIAEDLAGNTSTSTTEFDIDNEDLDAAYRGFKDVSFGIGFLYPWAWGESFEFEDEEGGTTLVVTNIEGDIAIYIEAYPLTSIEDIVANSEAILNDFGAAVNDPIYAEFNGYDAAQLDYFYTNEDGVERTGAYFMIVVPENNITFTIDLDTSIERAEEAAGIFQVLLNSLNFFPAYQVVE